MAKTRFEDEEKESLLSQAIKAAKRGEVITSDDLAPSRPGPVKTTSSKIREAAGKDRESGTNDALIDMLGRPKHREYPVADLNKEEKPKGGLLDFLAMAGMSGDSTLPANNTTVSANAMRANPLLVQRDLRNKEKYDKQRQEQAKKTAEWAEEHPVLASAASVASAPFAMADMLEQMTEVSALGHSLPHANQGVSEVTQNLRAGASSDMSKVSKFFYNTAMSGVDSYIAAMTGTGALSLAGGAASSAMHDIKARGGDDQQAIVGGIAAGVFEQLFESVSIGQLKALREMPADSVKAMLKNAVKSVATNASEEAATELANITFDTLYMDELSSYELLIKDAVAQGMSEEEASKAAVKALTGQIVESALSGAVMGAGMSTLASGGSALRQHTADSSTGKRIKQNSQEYSLIQEGLNAEADSDVNRLAQQLADQVDRSKTAKVPNAQLGKLARTMAEAQATAEAVRPKTATQEAVEQAQAQNPTVKVMSPTAQVYTDQGISPKAADAAADVMDRVLAGDTTLTESQKRKLNLNSPAYRAAFTQLTGVEVANPSNRRAWLADVDTAISQAATQAQAAAEARAAEQANAAAEARAAAESEVAAEVEQGARTMAEAATETQESAGVPGEQFPNLARTMAQDGPVAQAEASTVEADPTEAPLAEAAAKLAALADQVEQRSAAAGNAGGGATVKLTNGESIGRAEFTQRFQAAHPEATTAEVSRAWSEAERTTKAGGAYLSAMLQTQEGPASGMPSVPGAVASGGTAQAPGKKRSPFLPKGRRSSVVDQATAQTTAQATAQTEADGETGPKAKGKQKGVIPSKAEVKAKSLGTGALPRGSANDTMGTTRYSLKEDRENGGARDETRAAFLRRATGEGLAVYEGDQISYGYRPVQGESAGENARQVQKEVKSLGIDADIIDGPILWNYNGITSVREVPQAVTANGSHIFISNSASLSPRNMAGHEAFHLWKNSAGRDVYIEIVEDNLIFTNPDFLNYQRAIAEAYLGGEADLTDDTQVKKLREELFAYISGDIHEGVNDEFMRPMFRDFDAVKAAWNSLVRENVGETRFSLKPSTDAATKAMAETETREQSRRREQEWTVRRTNAILRKSGSKLTVELDYNGMDNNEPGFFDRDTNAIHLNGNILTTQRALVHTLGHEFVHTGSDSTRLKLVEDILNTSYGTDEAGQAALAQDVEGTRRRYIDFYTQQKGLSPEDAAKLCDDTFIREEVAADAMREVLLNTGGLYRMARENTGLLRNFRRKASDMLMQLSVKDEGGETLEQYKALRGIVDRLDEALRVAGKVDSVEETAYDKGESREEVVSNGAGQLRSEERYGAVQYLQEVPGGADLLRGVPRVDTQAEARGELHGVRTGPGEGQEAGGAGRRDQEVGRGNGRQEEDAAAREGRVEKIPPAKPRTKGKRHSVESDALIRELNQVAFDDDSPLSLAVQSRVWLLPEIVATRGQKFTNTKALPNRGPLRQRILDKLYANGSWSGDGYNGPVRRERHADIVIGLPGSGKSSVAVNPLSQKFGAKVIDSDMAKELIPEYNNGKGAAMVHGESSMIRDALLDYVTDSGDNMVLATVGASRSGLLEDIEYLKRKGYTVAIHYVDATPTQALSRLISRFVPLGQDAIGRYTPPDVLFDAGNRPKHNFEYLKSNKEADEFEYYDNRKQRGEDPQSTAGPGGVRAAAGGAGELQPGRPGGAADGETLGGGYVSGNAEESVDAVSADVPRRAEETGRRGSLRPDGADGFKGGISKERIAEIAETPAFKQWFHDGKGALLDDDGLPMVFYHGSGMAGYTKFEQQENSEPGFWFAKSHRTSDAHYYTGRGPYDPATREFVPRIMQSWEDAADYLVNEIQVLTLAKSQDGTTYNVLDVDTGELMAEYPATKAGLDKLNNEVQYLASSAYATKAYKASRQATPPNPGMYQVFLSMKNPLEVFCGGKHWSRLSPFMVNDKAVQDELLRIQADNSLGEVTTQDFTGIAQDFGYDGVIFRDVLDGRTEMVGRAALLRPGLMQEAEELARRLRPGTKDVGRALTEMEVMGLPSNATPADKALWAEYMRTPQGRTITEEIPDDDFIVFDGNQIKSVHNAGTFSARNKDIRYSVSNIPWADQVDRLKDGTLNQVLRRNGNLNSVMYIRREVPAILQEVGLSDLPLITTQRHARDMMTPRYDKNGLVINDKFHDLSEEQMKKLPDMIANPVAIFKSDPNGKSAGGINILTPELDSQGYPIFVTINPDRTDFSYDGVSGPAHFVNAFGRVNYESFIEQCYKNGSVLYLNEKEVHTHPLVAASIRRHNTTYSVDFDTILADKDPTVKPGERRYSVDRKKYPVKTGGSTGNVNPDTGYEKGSIADSMARILHGDEELGRKVLQQVVDSLNTMQQEQEAQRRKEATSATFAPKGKLAETAVARNRKAIQALLDKYGEMPQTSAAQQPVHFPKKIDKDTKVRGFMQTAAAVSEANEAVLDEFERAIVEGDAGATYIPIKDATVLAKVKDELKRKDFRTVMAEWEGLVHHGKHVLSKADIAMGEQLLIEAMHNKDVASAMRLTADLAAVATQAGQVVQAMTLLKKMSPTGKLYYVQRAVDNLNRKQVGKHKEIVINEQLAKALLEAKTAEEIQQAMDALIQDIADQTPVTWEDKWNAWRYLSMLGNPRTHVRNWLGNAIFVPVRLAKDAMGTTLERMVLPQDQRTKALVIGKDLREFAKMDAEEMKDILTGGGKQNPSDMIRDKRRIFKNGILNWAQQKNDQWLNKEDWLFLRSAYQRSLSSFLAARGYTVGQISGPSSTPEGRAVLDQARTWAVREAQKATYRDMSKLANLLNHLKRNSPKPVRVIFEGIVPFTKTPINIVKRGLEYSPVGLADGIISMATDVRKGDSTAAEGLDKICAGMTGTMVMAVGYFLSRAGILIGAHGDDEEDRFDELQGEQEYSLNLGDKTYTIDWAAPVALPLFVGAELYHAFHTDADVGVGERFSAVVDSMTSVLEPILSLSMLDGLNKTLSANRFGDEDNALYSLITTAAQSYAAQGIPTLLGQIARTVDDTRRTSFTPKGMGKVESSISRVFQSNVLGKTPGASKKRMPYIDAWGRTDTEGSVLIRAFENFVSPGYLDRVKTTPVEEELARLAEAQKVSSVFPDRATKYFALGDGTVHNMTQEEYQAHLLERGQRSYQLVGDIINDSLYQELDDATRVEAVNYAYEYAANLAKIHTDPTYSSAPKWVSELEQAEKRGIDPAEYLMLKAEAKVTGENLTTVALGSKDLSDVDVANIVAMEYNTPDSFADPYRKGYEYRMTDKQTRKFEEVYLRILTEEYTRLTKDKAFQKATASGRYDMLTDVKRDVGEATRKEISDWLYHQGIDSTPKK